MLGGNKKAKLTRKLEKKAAKKAKGKAPNVVSSSTTGGGSHTFKMFGKKR